MERDRVRRLAETGRAGSHAKNDDHGRGFILLSLSPDINEPGYGNVFTSSGLPLLINELFFLSASALGASFAALSQLDRNISHGTYEVRHQSACWTRFLLGIIAGILLATLVDVQDDANAGPAPYRMTAAVHYLRRAGGAGAASPKRALLGAR